jgi:type IV pilus assembly protein PilY1
MNSKRFLATLILALAAALPAAVWAQQSQIITDDFTKNAASGNWASFNGACLTAGDGTGTIPACIGMTYYNGQNLVGGDKGYLGSTAAPSTADPLGHGALRFTNGYPNGYSQNGAIVSNFTFPNNAGLQVTFTTVTYRGDSGSPIKDGADGISFFLMDGSKPPDIGAWGGSLGYSCSNANPPYRGLDGAYVGLGIDEYGNFLNGTSLMPGYSGGNNATGDNTAWGYGYHPGRIGLRGAGNVTWGELNAAFGTDPGSTTLPYYPASLATACTSGTFISSQSMCATGCPAGGTYIPATNICESCPSGGTLNTVTGSCVNICAAGSTYVPGTGCESCPAGATLDTTTGMCTTLSCADTVNYRLQGSPQQCWTCSNGLSNLRTSSNTCRNNGTASPVPPVSAVAAATVATPTSVVATSGPPNYAATQDLRPSAVQNTCRNGTLWNYSSPGSPSNAGATTLANSANVVPNSSPKQAYILDYAPITAVNSSGNTVGAYQELPAGQLIANEAAVKRSDGTPITYNLKITSDNKLSLTYAYQGGATQSVITNQDITASNGPLPATLRFGFAGSTGGSTNIHEIMCFKVTPADQAQSSAGLNEKQSARVETGTQVYFAFYNPSTWAGSLTSHSLVMSGNTLTIGPSNWDAACVLTGVASGSSCPATGQAGPVAAQGSASRRILSWNGTTGIAFTAGGLSGAETSALNTDSQATNRVGYLRGDRTNEVNSLGQGLFRYRTSVLGDIVDSSPTWVGAPSATYPATWKDSLYTGATAPETAYSAYVSTTQQRLNVVYSGANDGMLHGFRTGVFTTPTTFDGTLNDGQEVLAYVPGATLAGSVLANGGGTKFSMSDTIHGTDPTNSNAVTAALDYSNPQYGHNFYVDAPPGTGDLFYGGKWHSWLVGGMGPGGAVIYALDVTDPTQFSELNASSLVIGEWNAATIVCVGNGSCGQNLGNTYGVPQIRRFHNGQWGAVFGNGLGSLSGDAGIFVMLVDSTSGSTSFYYLSTGSSGQADGITYATPADLDGDHVVDYVYAGDINGHVWRFDLTSANPAAWAVSASSPIYTTPSGQPITTKLAVVAVPTTSTGPARILVDFGTGRQIPVSNFSSATYASGTQYLYGVWDWDTNNWNSLSSTQYVGLSSVPTANLVTQTATDLTQASGSNPGYRSVTANAVCYKGSTTCSGTATGWVLALPDTSGGNTEQVLYSPVVAQGAFIVNTTVPPNNSPTTCTTALAGGWTMAISPATGGAFPTSFFGDQNGNFVTVNNKVVSGVQLSGTGSPTVVTTDTTNAGSTSSGVYLVTQTVSGTGAIVKINPPAGTKGGRVTWIERR